MGAGLARDASAADDRVNRADTIASRLAPTLSTARFGFVCDAKPVGAGLARDASAAVGQPNRADTIASKPAPTLSTARFGFVCDAKPVGAGLARDAGAAVGQPNRADTIAGKPAPTHRLNRCSQQNFHVRTTQAGTLFSCYFPFAVLSLESQLPGGVTRTSCEQGRYTRPFSVQRRIKSRVDDQLS